VATEQIQHFQPLLQRVVVVVAVMLAKQAKLAQIGLEPTAEAVAVLNTKGQVQVLEIPHQQAQAKAIAGQGVGCQAVLMLVAVAVVQGLLHLAIKMAATAHHQALLVQP
jgi:hypothetical protein